MGYVNENQSYGDVLVNFEQGPKGIFFSWVEISRLNQYFNS